jgi:hypothetical protein
VPVVIDRRRVLLLDPRLPSRPYEHETRELNSARAEALVKEVRESALRCAERELARLRSSIEGGIVGIVLREPPLTQAPQSVAAAHADYTVMNRADGMIYDDALREAAAGLGIPLQQIRRGGERARAAEVLGTDVEHLERWLTGMRASLGPPWQKDHQDAAARAIAGLGKFVKLRLN